MTKALTKQSDIYNQIARVKTPDEGKRVEAIAAAAKAWAKEQGDYEGTVNAMHVWIMARRKTTGLIKPHIKHGGDRKSKNQSDNDVTLISDFGFTGKQWQRRCQELEIGEDEINAYFDDCISKGWEPTRFGLILWKDSGGTRDQEQVDQVAACKCGGEFETVKRCRKCLLTFSG